MTFNGLLNYKAYKYKVNDQVSPDYYSELLWDLFKTHI